MKTVLSKSRFLQGLQCHKALWLHAYNPELATPPDESRQAIFETGKAVGILAQGLFPGGETVEYGESTFAQNIRLTQELIQSGVETIYEATFSHDGVLAMVDILHKGPDGWEIYEVKSTTRVKDEHLPDLAVQYYVLAGSGLPVSKACLVHLNNEYVRRGELDVAGLFVINDLSVSVRANREGMGERLEEMKALLREDCPGIDIGPCCNEPYECEFKAHCWAHIPDYSVFNLYRMDKGRRFDLYYQGIVRLEEIPPGFKLNAIQKKQVEAVLTGRELVEPAHLRKFLGTVRYPLCFLDFETVQYAVPQYDGTRPYEQIPFQYSLHRLDDEGGELTHAEFLAEAGTDPREALTQRLIADIPPGAYIMAYNMAFEKGVIRRLAEQFPLYAERLMAIHDSIIDLIVPFRGGYYYTSAMKGEFSIKSVLPALVPELSYNGMEISNGGLAMHAYATLHQIEDKAEVERIRKALLEYCRLDTLAMVRVLERLRVVAG